MLSPGFQPRVPAGEPLANTRSHPGQFLVAGAIAIYLAIQILVPLRHLVYPGNVSWTEEGHRFAWHMKLRSKSGEIRFFMTNPLTGATQEIDPHIYLTPLQVSKMAFHPDMILQFSHLLADELSASGESRSEVRVCAVVTLNGRPPQLLIDPTIDLASVEHSLAPASWILPLDGSTPSDKRLTAKARTARCPDRLSRPTWPMPLRRGKPDEDHCGPLFYGVG